MVWLKNIYGNKKRGDFTGVWGSESNSRRLEATHLVLRPPMKLSSSSPLSLPLSSTSHRTCWSCSQWSGWGGRYRELHRWHKPYLSWGWKWWQWLQWWWWWFSHRSDELAEPGDRVDVAVTHGSHRYDRPVEALIGIIRDDDGNCVCDDNDDGCDGNYLEVHPWLWSGLSVMMMITVSIESNIVPSSSFSPT